MSHYSSSLDDIIQKERSSNRRERNRGRDRYHSRDKYQRDRSSRDSYPRSRSRDRRYRSRSRDRYSRSRSRDRRYRSRSRDRYSRSRSRDRRYRSRSRDRYSRSRSRDRRYRSRSRDRDSRNQSRKRRMSYNDGDSERIRKKRRLDQEFEDPHIAQVFLNEGYELKTDIPFERILREDAPRLEYRRRKGEEKTVIHWGQRKLLLSEIEFLTLYAKENMKVVYAGSAPGPHIVTLAEMFPTLEFYLYDPAPFSPKLIEFSRLNPRVNCHQELFTDDIASSFKGKDPLFISDIRSADYSLLTRKETEDRVLIDMQMQLKWHYLMESFRTMFKYRFPYYKGTTKYISGDVYLPVWGPITTTECRLITPEKHFPKDDELVEFDHKVFEEQMFYFNTIQRVALYEHNIKGEGLDRCYDCMSEITILKNYLEKYAGDSDIEEDIAALSERISRDLGHRTLSDPNSDPEVRRQGIESRQHINGRPAYYEEKKPLYSDMAKNYLSKFGGESGLGKNNQGTSDPLQANGNIQGRGLGYQ
eukprot:TRINITY_DN191_c0_g1_i4.p1 TRINITY_DN191_c0_g1~~TRINITY_DN191_c0_g1_i4.p1  ORF type:complete len:530 (-),score=86.08 TRINITY_DN191_c0_g1_i4:225-1814(-)